MEEPRDLTEAGKCRQDGCECPCYYRARGAPGRNAQAREASGVSGIASRQDKQEQRGGYEDGTEPKEALEKWTQTMARQAAGKGEGEGKLRCSCSL